MSYKLSNKIIQKSNKKRNAKNCFKESNISRDQVSSQISSKNEHILSDKESQNQSIAEIGRDLWRLPGPVTLLKAVNYSRLARAVSPLFEGGDSTASWHTVLVFSHSE